MAPTQPEPHPLGLPAHGQQRAVIDAVLPAVDGGRFAVKCVAGEVFTVTAHCFADGHDAIRVMLRWRADGVQDEAVEHGGIHEVAMQPLGNDEWMASFTPPVPGRYLYTVQAWVDHFLSWRNELARRVDEGDIRLALRIGADMLHEAATQAAEADRFYLREAAGRWRTEAEGRGTSAEALKAMALDDAVFAVASRYPDRRHAVQWPVCMPLVADRLRARFSAWYELFPRSAAARAGQHGTLADVMALLPYVAAMGFDVVYLPPIHPIGRIKRKGRNNAEAAQEGDVGSPWAIGAEEGGHKALHPQLGTMEDFQALLASAAELHMEIALDIAFQCAPDHPYVNEHRTWFKWRPDGTVQYAENPPKKYQDIYPFDFESEDWPGLWQELKSVFDFWIDAGVRIFRVDNPHTKAFAFWEWAIAQIKAQHPDVIFLSEAFTRPKVMHRLAKLGFTQSYTYFTWRQTADDLKAYFTELAHGPGRSYFRPNVWPNTPDILHAQFHGAGRATFALRVVLAATLSPSYGIYGPAYELMDNRPRQSGSEEYLDSEKYQLRHWGELSLDRADSLAGLIAHLNRIRKHHPALQGMDRLSFHDMDNPLLLAYSKRSTDGLDVILTVVNLDPRYTQSGWLTLDASELGLPADAPFEVHDLLTGQHFSWQGRRHFIQLDPNRMPAHICLVRHPSQTIVPMR
ncbi:MAG: alpha-1,4-glucan--maltose-1-phosphate maltosyltransferase [Aquabacterium sp.]